jgi:predicted dehydrogenase
VRFFPGYAALAERVAAGSVGRPRIVRASRISAAPEGAEWLSDDRLSGGLLVDFAIHDFDQAGAYLGRPVAVTSIPAVGPAVGPRRRSFGSPFVTTVEYDGGGLAQVLSASDLPPGQPFHTSFEVVGDAGVDAAAPDAGDAFAEQARYFVECVDTGTPPTRAPVVSAVEALRVALAARESARSAHRVELDPAAGSA